MRCNSYQLENFCHFVQTSNQLRACKIEPNDKRTIVIRVKPLETIIPWREKLVPLLMSEAPDYLARLLSMRLPPAAGRLFLPIISTPDKEQLMRDADDDKRGQILQALSRCHRQSGQL